MIQDGKYNSTAIKNEKFIKEEPKWGVVRSKSVSKTDSMEDRYYSSEYSSSFNPNETSSFMEESGRQNDSFPTPLNPLFDLQALVMVRITLMV